MTHEASTTGSSAGLMRTDPTLARYNAEDHLATSSSYTVACAMPWSPARQKTGQYWIAEAPPDFTVPLEPGVFAIRGLVSVSSGTTATRPISRFCSPKPWFGTSAGYRLDHS